MKVKVITDLDLDSGDFELTFKNVSHPGEGMDYNLVKRMMEKIFLKLDNDVENSGVDSTDLFTKNIH